MKITVTGSRGFIGSKVYTKLRILGHDVKGVDIGDSLEPSDVIVHCGAKLDSSESSAKNNIALTRLVVENAPKIIFTSSAAVYGNKSRPVSEYSPLNPINNYGMSKMKEEEMIRLKAKKYSIFRLSNVWGYDSDHGVIANFLRGEKTVYADLVRDYVFVEDVVNVLVQAAIADKWEGLFNLSSGKGISTVKLFKRFFPNEEPVFSERGEDEIQYSVLNNERAISRGFKPFVL